MADRSIAIQLKLEVDGLKRNAKEAGDALGGIGKKAEKGSTGLLGIISKNEQAITKFGNATGVAGLAVAAGVGLVVQRFAEFDQAMSGVAATGADAEQNLDSLRELAIRLGADTKYSASEAAEGITELLKAGVSAKDVLGGGLAGALDLAAAGQLAVGDAAEIAATAMVQFNLEGAQVPHIADLLAAGAGKAQGEVTDMAYALKQSGLVASQMGISVEETTGTLAAFASAGLLGSDAGTSFRTMLLRLANPTDQAANAMRRIGLNAYDANGEFVGMKAIAGQLSTGLSKLTKEQQDQTLATIFGSDAIRAANVLYKLGAGGIQEWTDNVNDSGFAARQASKLNDNLAGDIERLGGSFDTALIKSGSAGNVMLRKLVQTAEDLVDGIGELDQGTLETTVQIAAMAAGGLLAVSALAKLATGFVSAVETGRNLLGLSKELATRFPRMASSLQGATAAAGLLAVAIGALAVANGVYLSSVEGVAKTTNEMKLALLDMADGADKSANDLLKVREGLFAYGAPLDSVQQKLQLWRSSSDEASRSMIALTKNIGLGTEAADLLDNLDKMDDALSSMDSANAARTFEDIRKEFAGTDATAEDLIGMFPKLAEKMRAMAVEAGYNKISNEELVDLMGGKMPEAMKSLLSSTEDGRQTLEDLGIAADGAAKSLEDLRKEQEEAAKSTLDADKAHDRYLNTLDEVKESLKGAKGGIEGNTKAARTNRDALYRLVDAHLDDVEAMRKNKSSAEDIAKAQGKAYDSFVKAAKGAGATSEQAARLAIEYGLIPKKVTTDIGAPGAKGSKKEVEELNRELDDIDPVKRAEIIGIYKDKGIKEAQRAIASIKSKTVVINVKAKVDTSTGNVNVGKIGGKTIFVPGYADGGVLPGYTPGRDVHRFYSPTGGGLELSGGEAIMRPEFTRAVGGKSGVDRLNALARNGSLKFADGGVYRPAPLSSGRASGGLSSGGVVQQVTQNFPNLNPQAAFQAAGRYLKGLM